MKAKEAKRYYHRDLSWLLFNRRVILQAYDETVPFFEQLKFLAIATGNLDEFFMVRVPSIQTEAKLRPHHKHAASTLSNDEILDELYRRNSKNVSLQYARFHELFDELRNLDVHLKTYNQLTTEEKQKGHEFFDQSILPAISPIGLDTYHAMPKVVEKSVHLFVHLSQNHEEKKAIIPLPPLFDRVHKITGTKTLILLEELIAPYLEKIFVGCKIKNYFSFRVTYSKNLEFEEDSEGDIVEQMEDYLYERNQGFASRLEVSVPSQYSELVQADLSFIKGLLKLKTRDIYRINGPLDLRFLFSFIAKNNQGAAALEYKPVHPFLDKALSRERLFDTLDQRDVLLHHPYDSYEPVLYLLEEAAKDPNTIAIKQTLYRMAQDSRVIDALVLASLSGKQVTVLVELKARFDEANNLNWVKVLEESGCYVSYGIHQLKTHSKATLIVKRVGNEIKRYVHLATGNYNEKTAKVYTDLSFLTSDLTYCQDVTEFFNYLSGYRDVPDYQRLAVSPFGIREMLMAKIDQQIAYHQQTGKGLIFFKVNALTDKKIIDKLYEAAKSGVRIELIVRGACCLIPKIDGLSDQITVRSIVGRFLEHSRIYAFQTDTGMEAWLSSADTMTRNMVNRIEIATQIVDPHALSEMTKVINVFLTHHHKTFLLTDNEAYLRITQANQESAQEAFIAEMVEKVAEQSRQIKRLPEKRQGDLLNRLRNFWMKKKD
ncbi:MAG: polyphosphate kinase 1 [Streptococcaceae bacterium]|jgi:polyphosphate kinase|nr:polyphosphate kinase 1 [Streptococcaceae bacterium]